jgi:hypothetical protein
MYIFYYLYDNTPPTIQYVVMYCTTHAIIHKPKGFQSNPPKIGACIQAAAAHKGVVKETGTYSSRSMCWSVYIPMSLE